MKIESIEIEHNSQEAGNRMWVMATSDAASLECRIGSIDTVLNKNGIDPMLYDVYKIDSPYGEDMHTLSSFAVFGDQGAKVNAMEIEDEKGEVHLCLEQSILEVKRNGQSMTIEAKDLAETDEVLQWNLKPKS